MVGLRAKGSLAQELRANIDECDFKARVKGEGGAVKKQRKIIGSAKQNTSVTEERAN